MKSIVSLLCFEEAVIDHRHVIKLNLGQVGDSVVEPH